MFTYSCSVKQVKFVCSKQLWLFLKFGDYFDRLFPLSDSKGKSQGEKDLEIELPFDISKPRNQSTQKMVTQL